MMSARSARDQVCHGAMENGWSPLNVQPGLRNSRSMAFCSWSGGAFGAGIVVVRLAQRPPDPAVRPCRHQEVPEGQGVSSSSVQDRA